MAERDGANLALFCSLSLSHSSNLTAALTAFSLHPRLRCLQVSWLKNDEPLNREARVSARADHNLMVSEAPLSDSGNYTCLASNIVAKRRSGNAAVVVYGELGSCCRINCTSKTLKKHK